MKQTINFHEFVTSETVSNSFLSNLSKFENGTICMYTRNINEKSGKVTEKVLTFGNINDEFTPLSVIRTVLNGLVAFAKFNNELEALSEMVYDETVTKTGLVTRRTIKTPKVGAFLKTSTIFAIDVNESKLIPLVSSSVPFNTTCLKLTGDMKLFSAKSNKEYKNALSATSKAVLIQSNTIGCINAIAHNLGNIRINGMDNQKITGDLIQALTK